MSFDSSNWNYFSEGASNIVLKYSGNDVKYVGRVLRVKKRTDLLDWGVKYTMKYSEFSVCVANYVWGNEAHKYFGYVDVVRLKETDTLNLIKNIEIRNGVSRTIEIHPDQIYLIQDATSANNSLDTISVEIKPKWCIFSHKKHRFCFFCAKQLFCPENLLARTISSTYQTLNTIYSNKRCFGKNIRFYYRNKTIKYSSEEADKLLLVVSVILHENSFAKRLVKKLKHLADTDMDEVYKSYLNIVNDPLIISKLKREYKNVTSNTHVEETSYTLVARYLLYRTLRDLSFMVTITKDSLDRNRLGYTIHALDLEEKPHDKIPGYRMTYKAVNVTKTNNDKGFKCTCTR